MHHDNLHEGWKVSRLRASLPDSLTALLSHSDSRHFLGIPETCPEAARAMVACACRVDATFSRFRESVVYRGHIPGLPTAIRSKTASKNPLAPPFSPPNYRTRSQHPHCRGAEFSDVSRIAGKMGLPAAFANILFHSSIL
jgi:hypothetical protein